MSRSLPWVAVILVAAWLFAVTDEAMAQPKVDYTIGWGDKVRITVFGRPDLSGEFTVRRSGSLSLPLVGEFAVTTLTLSEIENVIAERLKHIGLADQHITVQVLEYRPFYILGDVAIPGRYPYAEGLTVLQAIAIAGGVGRPEDRHMQYQLQMIHARENLDVLLGNYRLALAREARLVAERDGLPEIAFPSVLTRESEQPKANEIMEGEIRLFHARRDALSDTVALLERRKTDAEEEMTALKAQVKSKRTEADLVALELRDVQGLVDKGLSPKTRLLNLKSTAAAIEGEVLAIRASIAQAKQDAARDELAILTERSEFRSEVIAELQDVHAQIAELEPRLSSLARVLDLGAGALVAAGASTAATERTVKVIITRDIDGSPKNIEATQYTTILPGDTIQVSTPTDASASPLLTGDDDSPGYRPNYWSNEATPAPSVDDDRTEIFGAVHGHGAK